MKTNIFIVTLLILFFNISCSNSDKKELSDLELKRTGIQDKEKELYERDDADPEAAADIVERYIEFVNSYPDDPMAPEYMFKASEVAMNFKDFSRSIECLTKIELEYPEYEKYGTAIFLKAFIFENHIVNNGMAKIYYKKFIEEYPDHIMAKDAENALIFLGMTDDELVKIFEQMN